MPQTPQQATASERYGDGWRAISELIRGDGSWSGRERNKYFRNSGDGTFEDVSYVAGMDFDGDGRGQAAVDYDHDGDLDLILSFRTGPQLRIMRNDIGAANTSLILDLKGTKGNRDAVGARVVLKTNRRTLMRESLSGTGFLSQPSRRIHVGLAAGEVPESLAIRWPDGTSQTIAELPASGLIYIEQGNTKVVALKPAPPAPIEAPPADYRATEGTWLVSPLPAPVFTAKGLDGREYSLASFQGRKVLLNFWSTSCPPCRGEFEDFSAKAEELKSFGVNVLAISVDGPEDEEKVRKFASEFNLPFAVLLGNDEVIPTYSTINRYLFNRRRDLGVPTSYLVDEAGMIVKTYVGTAKADTVLADAAYMRGPSVPFPGKWVTAPPERNYLEMATALAQRGKSTEAMVLFEHAVAEGYQGYELYTNLAAVLTDEGNTARAESFYRKALELKPGQVEAVSNLSGLLLSMGRPQEALDLLAAVLPHYPDDIQLLSAAGSAEFQLQHLEEAEKYMRKAVVVAPGGAEHRFNLAAVLATMGRHAEAIEEFQNAALLGRGGADLHNNLGALYMQTGQSEQAAIEFHKALEADPNDFGARMNLAVYHLNDGDAEQGMRQLKAAQQSRPEQPAAFLVEAEVLAQRGQTAAARAILEKLLLNNPKLERARELLNQIR